MIILLVVYVLGAVLVGYPMARTSLKVWKKGWEAQPEKVGHGFVGFLVFPYSCWFEHIGDPLKPTVGLYLCEAHHCNEPAGEVRYKRFTTLFWPCRLAANIAMLVIVAVIALDDTRHGYGPKQDII